MSQPESNEYLSAFVDGELQGPARGRVVDALYGSPELRRAWARFHLIGDVVSKRGPVPGAGSIAGNVSAALSRERIGHFKPRPRWPRFYLGLAFAAAISAMAILGIHGLDDGGVQPPAGASVSRPELAAATPDPTAPRIVSTAAQPAAPEATRLQWSDVAPDAEARLNAYLVNHNEYGGNGMRGVLPYVRIVGYQSAAGDYR